MIKSVESHEDLGVLKVPRISSTDLPKLSTPESISPDFNMLRRVHGLIRDISVGMLTNSNRQCVVYTDDVESTSRMLQNALLTFGLIGEQPETALTRMIKALALSTPETIELDLYVDRKPLTAEPGEEWKSAPYPFTLSDAHPARSAPYAIDTVLDFKFGSEEFLKLIEYLARDGAEAIGPQFRVDRSFAAHDIHLFGISRISGSLIKHYQVDPQKFAFVGSISSDVIDGADSAIIVNTLVSKFMEEARTRHDNPEGYLTKTPKGIFVLPIEAHPLVLAEYNKKGAVSYFRMREYTFLSKPFNSWLPEIDTELAAVNQAYVTSGLDLLLQRGTYADSIIGYELEKTLTLVAKSVASFVKKHGDSKDPLIECALTKEELDFLLNLRPEREP